MDIYSLRWFIVGVIASLPFHYLLLSAKPQISNMRFENKLAINTIVQMLGLLLIIGGFTFSIYGNYLTAKAGEGKMNSEEFTNLANQFYLAFRLYVGLIWVLAGIAVGTGLILMVRSAYRYFKQKRTKSSNNQDTEQDILVSPKELIATITKIEGYKKAKSNLDNFFNIIKDDKPKEK